MGFPQTGAPTETSNDTNTTTHNASMPATVAEGDGLIAIVGLDNQNTITTPDGWTQLWHDTAGAFYTFAGYVKVADGTEGGTTVNFVTNANSRFGAQVYLIEAGTWGGEVASVADGTPVRATTNAPNPPAVSPSWGTTKDTLWFVTVNANNETNANVTSYPSNYTNGAETQVGAAGALIATARRELNATSENPGVYDLVGAVNLNTTVQTFAIEGTEPPKGGGGGGGQGGGRGGGKGGGGGNGGGGGGAGSGGGGNGKGGGDKSLFVSGRQRRARGGF